MSDAGSLLFRIGEMWFAALVMFASPEDLKRSVLLENALIECLGLHCSDV